jgi:hypothetical protein
MGPDVVPELSEQAFVGVVVGVGLGIGNLKIRSELMGDGERRIAENDQ